MKIGIITDGFRLPLRQALQQAASLGARGVQIYAVEGEMAPENLDSQARQDLKRYMEDLGLEVAALCADMGGHAFTVAEDNPRRVDRSMRIMDLALDLGAPVVTTHIGVVPEDPKHPRYAVMQEACRQLAWYGEKVNCRFAVETGPEKATTLRAFLDSLGCKGMGVNLDPANLVMVAGDDPVAAVHTLAPYIVHTHAKDGVMVAYHDPEIIYDFFAEGGIGDLRLDECFREVPLGQGSVPWDKYLAALRDIQYDGYLTIERETGDDPAADIRLAVNFLRHKLA